jgi:hypothetical protein
MSNGSPDTPRRECAAWNPKTSTRKSERLWIAAAVPSALSRSFSADATTFADKWSRVSAAVR